MSTWEELEGKLYRAITGGRSPRTETVGQMLREIERAVGGPKEAMALLGAKRETYRRWKLPEGERLHQKPRREALEGLKWAVRRLRLPRGREARLRQHGDARVTIEAKSRYDRRDRSLTARSMQWRPGTVGRVIDAYLEGDMGYAAQQFHGGINDAKGFYSGWLDPDRDDSDQGFDYGDINLG